MISVEELKKLQAAQAKEKSTLRSAHEATVFGFLDELGTFLNQAMGEGIVGVASPKAEERDGAKTFKIAGEELVLVTGPNCHRLHLEGPLAARSFVYPHAGDEARPWFELQTVRNEASDEIGSHLLSLLGRQRQISGRLPATEAGGRKCARFFIDAMYRDFRNTWADRPRRGAFRAGGDGKQQIGFD
jgi:hypothetical protein